MDKEGQFWAAHRIRMDHSKFLRIASASSRASIMELIKGITMPLIYFYLLTKRAFELIMEKVLAAIWHNLSDLYLPTKINNRNNCCRLILNLSSINQDNNRYNRFPIIIMLDVAIQSR